MMEKIILRDAEPGSNPTSDELARIIVDRLGLNPRKENSTKDMYRTFLEFYERAKQAAQQKKPELAVITVEEMAIYAKITRQTMYDYLRRWTHLNMIVKTSYIKDTRVIIGYKLNGSTLESAFDKARVKIQNNLDLTQKYVLELQRVLKNEKISKAQRQNSGQYTSRNQRDDDPEEEYDEEEMEPVPAPVQRVARVQRTDAFLQRTPRERYDENQDFQQGREIDRRTDRAANNQMRNTSAFSQPASVQPQTQTPSPAPAAFLQTKSDSVKKEVPYLNSDHICFRDNNPILNMKEGSSEFIICDKMNNDVVRQSDEKFQSKAFDKRKKPHLLNMSKIITDPESYKDGSIEIVQRDVLLDDTTEQDNSGDDFEYDDEDERRQRVTESKGTNEDRNLGVYNNVTNNFG